MFAFNPDDCIVKGAQAENENANNLDSKDKSNPREKVPMKLQAPGISQSSLSKSSGRSSHLRAQLNARKNGSARKAQAQAKTEADSKPAATSDTTTTVRTPGIPHNPQTHSNHEINMDHTNNNKDKKEETALKSAAIKVEEEIIRDNHSTPPSTTSTVFHTSHTMMESNDASIVDASQQQETVTTGSEEEAPSPRGGVLTADGTTASLPAQSKEMLAATEGCTDNMAIDINMVVKILVVGNAKCGKSSIINRYTSNAFDNEYKTTVGADFVKKDVLIEHPLAHLVNTTHTNEANTHDSNKEEDSLDPIGVRIHLWDIAGQDRFQKLTRPYFNKAKAVVIVCDISREGTIEAVLNWKKEIDAWIDKTNNKHLPVVLFANKSDLLKDSVSAIKTGATMERMCREQNFLGWWITSARTGDTLQEAFYTLLQRVVQLEFEAQGLYVGGKERSLEAATNGGHVHVSTITGHSSDNISLKGVTAKKMGQDFQAKQQQEAQERAAKGIFKLDAKDYERERENNKYSEGVMDCC